MSLFAAEDTLSLAVEVQGLTKRYGNARGIENIDLAVQQGEIFGFIGPNGAGKTTTIRTLLNFLKPTSGRARIFGMDVVTDTRRIKQRVGYLPADVNYYDDMSAGDLLKLSARFHGVDAAQRIRELSGIFELDLTKKIRSLSTGNKKKVGIIQALLHRPDLLIFDEPTSGLDPLMQNVFFDLVRQENERGATVFFSSHILGEVQRMCDRVAIIRKGRIVDVQRIEQLRSQQYKKVRLRLKDPSQVDSLPIEGRTGQAGHGVHAEYMYRGSLDALVKVLARYDVEDVWIEDPPLEEIFLHYYEEGADR